MATVKPDRGAEVEMAAQAFLQSRVDASRVRIPEALLGCAASVVAEATSPQVIRTIHHFACTGGTLLSRSLQAQPGVRVISEVDPLSTKQLMRGRKAFAPNNLIALARGGFYEVSDAVVEQIFLGGLEALERECRWVAESLVLRDHAHSRYCTEVDPRKRRGVLDILREVYDTRSLVTVRHPIDSWLSMLKNDFIEFPDASLEEYCRRYLQFLSDHADVPVVHYEHFTADPESVIGSMCDILGLRVAPTWKDFLIAIRLSGDSGRTGSLIGSRARLALPGGLAEEARLSKSYALLCQRLDYAPEVNP
jgi:Sulfotransferase family